ncbi:DUF6143 family protein [Clostridium sp. B9]|uniref:DUF6143 family protein n=1 Tax=Clostridium sp. B9 TaxID=3423224 RepID=UPI003D2EA050
MSYEKPFKTISIPFDLYESKIENYFIGQTPTIIGQPSKAIALLLNPYNSRVNIYLNAITITNLSSSNLSGTIYLKSIATGTNSSLVSCANIGINPPPIPKGKIQSSISINSPLNGIPIFNRIVSPISTLVLDGSQIIISPGESVLVSLGELVTTDVNAIVAFGWWEEKIFYYGCYAD